MKLKLLLLFSLLLISKFLISQDFYDLPIHKKGVKKITEKAEKVNGDFLFSKELNFDESGRVVSIEHRAIQRIARLKIEREIVEKTNYSYPSDSIFKIEIQRKVGDEDFKPKQKELLQE